MSRRPGSFALRNRLLTTIAFGMLGLAANFFLPVTLFDNIQLLFGGIVYFFVAALWGPWYGMLAAALASLGLLPTLGSRPVTPLLAIGEAFTIGLLYRRKFEPVQVGL